MPIMKLNGKILRKNGKIGTSNKCCCGVDCYDQLFGGGPCSPLWVARSYVCTISGLTMRNWEKTFPGGTVGYANILDGTLPSQLCVPYQIGAGIGILWRAPWDSGTRQPLYEIASKVPPDTTPTVFSTASGLTLSIDQDPASPGTMYLRIMVGTSVSNANKGVIFYGSVTGVTCDPRGLSFTFTNTLSSAPDAVWNDPNDPGDPDFRVLGDGGTVTITPCCTPCLCPTPLATSYALDFTEFGVPYSGYFQLVGETDYIPNEEGDPGSFIAPDCYYESIIDGYPRVGFYLERTLNPCGWSIRRQNENNEYYYVTIPGSSPIGSYAWGTAGTERPTVVVS